MAIQIKHQWRYVDCDTHEVLHRFSHRRAERDQASGEGSPQEIWAIFNGFAIVADCYSPEDAQRIVNALQKVTL